MPHPQKLWPRVAFGRIIIGAIFCFVILAVFMPRLEVLALTQPPAPTILGPASSATNQPLIRGLTANNTKVFVYIDAKYYGFASVKNGKSGTASFAFQVKTSLKFGNHKITAKAENKNDSLSSGSSKAFNLIIEFPLPAPTLVEAVVNENTTNAKPFITGVAYNNSNISIYIDGKLNGDFWVANDPSGVANFAYKPYLALAAKDHAAYAIAKDKNGKVSKYSSTITFHVQNVNTQTSVQSSSTSSNTTTKQSTSDTPKTTEKDAAASSDANTNTNKNTNSNNTNKDQVENSNKNANSNTNKEDEKTNVNIDEEVAKTTNENENTNSSEENKDKGSNLVLWLVVIAIVIIIVVTRLTKKSDDQDNGSGSGQINLFDRDKEKTSGLVDVKPKQDKPEEPKDKDVPPPPPAASSY